MTPEELQQAIEANTRAIGDVNQSINFLVSNFIRPNAQQHQMFARLDERLERIDQQQDRSGQQIEAIAELTRSQLAGLISNGRRIDRLEQQAS